MTEHTKEWWNGHRAGFVKGLEEARLQAIDMAKENPDAASILRLLAHALYGLQQQ